MNISKNIAGVTVPIKMPKEDAGHFILSVKDLERREEFISEGMYGFISWKWILPFIEWVGDKRCLEVMAGRGWWSYALQQKGVSVHATDDFSWHEQGRYSTWKDTLVNMEKLDAVKAVKKYGEETDVVLMSWPYMDDTAYEVIKALHQVNPNAVVVYIGEGSGGCTASYAFFDHFYEIEDEAFTEVQMNFESWSAIRDEIRIGRFRP